MTAHAMTRVIAILAVLSLAPGALAQSGTVGRVRKASYPDKFHQLDELLPPPSPTRSPSGAPGPEYWQQQADYVIDVSLDDETQRVTGSETVTYHNNSPDTLRYIWFQLDQNVFAKNANSRMIEAAPGLSASGDGGYSFEDLRRTLAEHEFDGGFKIHSVTDAGGGPLHHAIVRTLMRVDLATPLEPHQKREIHIAWSYNVNDSDLFSMRCGYEHFDDDGNNIYEIAQWYPRVAAYIDVEGWELKEYVGLAEFALEFGNFDVRITVPEDHIVAATGVLQNPEEVLSLAQRQRLAEAADASQPVFIVTPDEAREGEGARDAGMKTWEFKAENVRDFSWAASRKFIWDAMGVNIDGRRVMAMSFYPNEAEPLWSQYSTQTVAHTLDVYSDRVIAYPYPVAISVNGPVGGMEYPMISFNGARPEKDGTYSEDQKRGLVSLIIHEVGHNWFPMIINSNERRWMWQDEGFNTFVQYFAKQEWEPEFPPGRGLPKEIAGYMKDPNQVPIMVDPEFMRQRGNNAYAKTATALNILRETILGRELFDFAFHEYARRWAFKRPLPSDFFRTMEDASGIDLDWFWRGWFYSTDQVDLSIERVHLYHMDTRDPAIDKAAHEEDRDRQPESLTLALDKDRPRRVEERPELEDFYSTWDADTDVLPSEAKAYQEFLDSLEGWEKELLDQYADANFYVVDFDNTGGLVSPIILEITYEDGSTEEIRIPAEIWRKNDRAVSKLFVTHKRIATLQLDPHLETADVDTTNNRWPAEPIESRFKLHKPKEDTNNPMRELRDAETTTDDADKE